MLSKNVLSMCTAVARTQLAQLRQFGVERALSGVGLTRRRTRVPESLAFLAAGVAVGGVAGLLFAPRRGAETRSPFLRQVNELGEAASQKWEQVRDELSEPFGRLYEDIMDQTSDPMR